MWHWVPSHMRGTLLNIPIVIGAILTVLGLVLWAAGGFKDFDALVCTALGVLIFFGFWKVKALQADFREGPPKE